MALSSSIQGIQNALQLQSSSAQAISKATTQKDSNIENHMVDQITSKGVFSLNVKVAKVQNEMLGELIDILG